MTHRGVGARRGPKHKLGHSSRADPPLGSDFLMERPRVVVTKGEAACEYP
jgi:hypothetical protein